MSSESGDALELLYDRARAAWPQVALSKEDFQAHVARLVSAGSLSGAEELDAPALYLALACGRGDPQALLAFERLFLPEVPVFIGRYAGIPGLADEVRQALRVRLFVAEEGRPPRILGYSGRGPLGGWVRVAALRLAHDLAASAQRSDRELDPIHDPSFAPANPDPQLDSLRREHMGAFREAFAAALEALPAEQANVVRFHFLGGLTCGAIAGLYGVNERTVRRWIEQARLRILAETHQRLAALLGGSPTEAESLVRLLHSQLGATVVRAFGLTGPGKRQP